MTTVAVDFDGVLHDYREGWKDGSIYGDWTPGAVVALTRLMQRYAVFVHTARDARRVARWIEHQSGHHFECTTRVPRSGLWGEQGTLLVTDRKLPAIAYVDDRAVRFNGDWIEVLSAVGVD